jgi:putative acetyltransferase
MRHLSPTITPGDFADQRVKALLKHHLEGMRAASPPDQSFALDWSGLQKPEIAFWTIWQRDEIAGCGALKDLGDGTAEIKSMRVWPKFLGQGLGQAMLTHVIAQARERGYKRLSLETGSGAPFDPAIRLYEKNGFRHGEDFADYVKNEFNNLMHLDL